MRRLKAFVAPQKDKPNEYSLSSEIVNGSIAMPILEIIKASASQEIWINAGLVHGFALEMSTRITIIDVQAVYSVAEYTSTVDAEADDFPIRVGS